MAGADRKKGLDKKKCERRGCRGWVTMGGRDSKKRANNKECERKYCRCRG